jgi:hypothetical protein
VDVVITRDNFCTLANVVIADLTRIILVQHALMMVAHVATIAIQDKA